MILFAFFALFHCQLDARALPSTMASQDAPQVKSAPAALVSMEKRYFVTYELQPTAIPLNQPFQIRVAVFLDEERLRPARDIELQVDARMPQHRHGMIRHPRVFPEGAGRYRVEGMLFHMPGRWELYFDITADGVTERAWTFFELD